MIPCVKRFMSFYKDALLYIMGSMTLLSATYTFWYYYGEGSISTFVIMVICPLLVLVALGANKLMENYKGKLLYVVRFIAMLGVLYIFSYYYGGGYIGTFITLAMASIAGWVFITANKLAKSSEKLYTKGVAVSN